jgi:hypothetical protein
MSAVSSLNSGRVACVHAAGLVAIAAAGLLAGCFVDSGSSSASESAGSAGGGSSSSSTAQSLLVDVDTNRTLEATPGQGIGVYVEYAEGGHWTVSWTCDTSLTNLSCNFDVGASVATGAITNLSGSGLGLGDSVNQPTAQELDASTTTTTGIDAVLFDTTPGATLTVNVTLNAPVSFFFVQDGQVNGGYKGALTNPLMFQPSSP